MIQIREKTFETNSSSTHTLIMCAEKDYDKWVKGELYRYNSCYAQYDLSEAKSGKFYTEEEAFELIKKLDEYDENDEEFQDLSCFGFQTFDEYLEEADIQEEKTYVTAGGEKIKGLLVEECC